MVSRNLPFGRRYALVIVIELLWSPKGLQLGEGPERRKPHHEGRGLGRDWAQGRIQGRIQARIHDRMRAWRDCRRLHRTRRKIAYSAPDREEMAAIRNRLDEVHGLQYCGVRYYGLNIATLPKVIVAECAYYGWSQCHIDPECHIDKHRIDLDCSLR
jgi:hypothetical protein